MKKSTSLGRVNRSLNDSQKKIQLGEQIRKDPQKIYSKLAAAASLHFSYSVVFFRKCMYQANDKPTNCPTDRLTDLASKEKVAAHDQKIKEKTVRKIAIDAEGGFHFCIVKLLSR